MGYGELGGTEAGASESWGSQAGAWEPGNQETIQQSDESGFPDL
jgi:hypothetical protein